MSFKPVPHHLDSADLLLINVDFSKNEMGVASPPENHLGLNRIASYLKRHGHTVQVMDTTGRPSSTNGPEELADWLLEYAPRYRSVGFHTNSWNINHILRILSRARAALAGKKLLFGGPLPNSEPFKTLNLLKDQGVDYIGVVQGLGEKITHEIISRDQLLGIEGLWVYEKGKIQMGHKMMLNAQEFEDLPFLDLDYHTFYQNFYKPVMEAGDLGAYGMEIIFGSQGLEVNRGCPFNCTYCSVPQYEEKLILFSPGRVVDELEYLANEGGFFMFTFTNSNIMFYQPEWIREFCREIIHRRMNEYINWTAYHHPSIIARLDIKDYELMRESGSDTIVFGVQSFEEEVLKKFMRPFNTKELTKIIREKSRAAGMELTVDYITGVPGENLDIVQEAFEYFIENEVECRNYQLKFYPNTKLPTMKMDLSQHDLVPITGNLAPELEAYAVVPKNPNPRSAQLDGLIREHSRKVVASRLPRLGKYIVDSADKAHYYRQVDIPHNAFIPLKVKRAMQLALNEMLHPKKREQHVDDLDPMKMMKKVILAGPDSPPMVLAMQAKLRDKLGIDQFEVLKAKYEQAGL